MNAGPPPRVLVAVVVVVNAGLLAAGLWTQLHPRSRVDVWRGAAMGLLAVVNVLAVTMARNDGLRLRARNRLWRIALWTNCTLRLTAHALVGAAFSSGFASGTGALSAGVGEAAPYTVLLAPAVITLLALRRPSP